MDGTYIRISRFSFLVQLGTFINVLEVADVVLTEIAACPNLNDL